MFSRLYILHAISLSDLISGFLIPMTRWNSSGTEIDDPDDNER